MNTQTKLFTQKGITSNTLNRTTMTYPQHFNSNVIGSTPHHGRKREVKTLQFIQSSLTSSVLREGDLVLLVIPEELELLQEVDASINGRTGYIINMFGDDVEVRLKRKKNNKKNYLVEQALETIFVTKFCLCLEHAVLLERVQSGGRSGC
jgi:hypothetical protein